MTKPLRILLVEDDDGGAQHGAQEDKRQSLCSSRKTMILVLFSLGPLLALGLFTYQFLRGWRDITFTPSRVHLVQNTPGSLRISLRRKKPWSFQTWRPVVAGPITLRSQLVVCQAKESDTPMTVMPLHGDTIVTLVGVAAGQGRLTAEAPAARAGEKYGPKSIPVLVYPSPEAVPPGVRITPLLVKEEQADPEEGFSFPMPQKAVRGE